MTKSTIKLIRDIVIIITIILGAYLALIFLLDNSTEIEKCNEFGDYIGGVLNPLFTLLSTTAIIYLTYIIARNEASRAEKANVTQERLTLNQLRQSALNEIMNKLNQYIYVIHDINVTDLKKGSLVQRIVTKQRKDKSEGEVTVWLTILAELECFMQMEYLFDRLFSDEKFNKIYEELSEITGKLSEEQGKMWMVTKSSLEKYIELQHKFVKEIGAFIYLNSYK